MQLLLIEDDAQAATRRDSWSGAARRDERSVEAQVR
jgi:hypothetical protein